MPTHIGKYKGDATKIVFRSSWELMAFKWIDSCKQIVAWSSETTIVPYIGVDGKPHRYFVDLWVMLENGKRFIIEIKPSSKLVKPRKTAKKKDSTYLSQLKEYHTIQIKKAAAEAYAKEYGMEYKIWTEKTFNIGK